LCVYIYDKFGTCTESIKSCYFDIVLSRNSRWNHTQIFSDFGDDDDEENDNASEFGRSKVNLSRYGSRAASLRYINFLKCLKTLFMSNLLPYFARVILNTLSNDCLVFTDGIIFLIFFFQISENQI
jgi:hypothetical protein